jgi:hypothetical protein
VGLDFFEDAVVPDYALQDPSLFDTAEGVWKWTYDGNDMYMDAGVSWRGADGGGMGARACLDCRP